MSAPNASVSTHPSQIGQSLSDQTMLTPQTTNQTMTTKTATETKSSPVQATNRRPQKAPFPPPIVSLASRQSVPSEPMDGQSAGDPPFVTKLDFHPFANIFPMLTGEAYENLREDIRKNGLKMPIIRHQGTGLDGRNRMRVCEELGIEPIFEEYSGNDPLAFIVSLNLHRRHLTESQRGMIASELVNVRRGQRTDLEPEANLPQVVSQSDAAEMMNVSVRQVRNAKAIKSKGTAEQVEAVRNGSKTIGGVMEEIKQAKNPTGNDATPKPKAATKKQQAEPVARQDTMKPEKSTFHVSIDPKTNKKTIKFNLLDVFNWDLLNSMTEPDAVNAIINAVYRVKHKFSEEGQCRLRLELWGD